MGNVNLTGSNARIRGAIITGDLVVAGSNAALSFTRVMGRASISGSSATLLEGSLCGGASVSGGAALFLGNVGLEPLGSCPGARPATLEAYAGGSASISTALRVHRTVL